jgi:hypothetical protein
MSVYDHSSEPGKRACEYPELIGFLEKPIPYIRLKYAAQLTPSEREKTASESGLTCSQCHKKVAVMGSTNTATHEVTCDICAIKAYKTYQGFRTLKAAKAHRRRMFDIGYLFTELLIDDYMAYHEVEYLTDLSDNEYLELQTVSIHMQNTIPKEKKIALENTVSQIAIEDYYRHIIALKVTIPSERQK